MNGREPAGTGAGEAAGSASRAPDGVDLDALRARLDAAPDAERLHPIGLGQIVAGPDALAGLPRTLAALLDDAGPVAMLVDATPMRRGGEDLKAAARALLERHFDVRSVVVGPASGEVHADEATLAAAAEGVAGCGAIVTVGSGTLADIGKATAAELDLPHLIVQTAASVNGFADDQSVLLRSGVKRTTPTRWPDALLLDRETLLGAPRAMNLAGLGDLVSMFTAIPDWLLAREVGIDDSWSATAAGLGRDHGRELLALAPRLSLDDGEAVVRLAEILALSGISMGAAGRTAPSSGMEHTVSHLIEMEAGARGAPTALHGARVGVTTILAALLWDRTMRRFAAGGFELTCPSEPEMEERVEAAFEPLDPSGAAAAECWADYRKKLRRWNEGHERIAGFVARWADVAPRFAELGVDPDLLTAALGAAGAPVRFSELDPPVAPEAGRWALANCHLMRDRFTIADFAFFSGGWEEEDVEALLAAAARLGAGL